MNGSALVDVSVVDVHSLCLCFPQWPLYSYIVGIYHFLDVCHHCRNEG
jgi:hypothetical protein